MAINSELWRLMVNDTSDGARQIVAKWRKLHFSGNIPSTILSNNNGTLLVIPESVSLKTISSKNVD